MTAVSLISPLAPQPAQNPTFDTSVPPTQIAPPVTDTAAENMSGGPSDQSGQGAGNGTGTGGAQIAALLEKSRVELVVQRPTPESVVEAQSATGSTDAFLERQSRLQVEAQAAEQAALARKAADRAAEAKAAAAEAAEPDYVMPNPLPTAPILEREAE